jgi:hypothetical protein
MNNELNFYNYFNNGDVFFSRIILKPFFNKFNLNFYHKEKHGLFRDIKNINENCGIPNEYDWEKNKIFISDDLYSTPINCWLAQTIEGRGEPFQNYPFPGCAFENYVELSKEISKLFELDTFSVEEYLPTVQYQNLENYENIKKLMLECKQKFNKIVLISNGDVRSSQSSNFNFFPYIDKISDELKNVLFITTENTNLKKNNILNSFEITNVIPDLLEISLISTFCDVIVGRASGPYCFSQVKENLLDTNKTFVCFCNNVHIAKFYQNCKCNVIWSPNYSDDIIYSNIKNALL